MNALVMWGIASAAFGAIEFVLTIVAKAPRFLGAQGLAFIHGGALFLALEMLEGPAEMAVAVVLAVGGFISLVLMMVLLQRWRREQAGSGVTVGHIASAG